MRVSIRIELSERYGSDLPFRERIDADGRAIELAGERLAELRRIEGFEVPEGWKLTSKVSDSHFSVFLRASKF